MIKNIESLQPHIVVNLGDSVHVLSLPLIRSIANGQHKATDEQARCLAVALKDYLPLDNQY